MSLQPVEMPGVFMNLKTGALLCGSLESIPVPYDRHNSSALRGEQSVRSFASCDESFHDDIGEDEGDSSALHPAQSKGEQKTH